MKYLVCYCLIAIVLSACTSKVQVNVRWQEESPLAKEYAGVVVPPNIAPLNFVLPDSVSSSAIILTHGKHSLIAMEKGGAFIPGQKEWKELISFARGKEIQIEHCVKTEKGWAAYQPFTITVAEEPIDPYLVYRLIPPGYEKWHEMGIYQRNLETFEETEILANRRTDYNCINCHSFCNQSPDRMMLHMRAKHAGTLLIDHGKMTKLDTKTDQTISSLVYPYWHPEGQFIAYSVNDTRQLFHVHHSNRIEVVDYASDVVVYDIQRNELLTTPALFSKESMETFPAFSADGTKLYFCSASQQNMPMDYEKVRYHLCSIDFDAAHRTFGSRVDTLFHADANGKSVSFPRVSPAGRFLLMTLSDYGNFSIWHQEADLWMIDLQTRMAKEVAEWNSRSVESYHSWSSNSRWVVFSSRRGDGLYTRPYIAYMDRAGNTYKPFLLPQKESGFYRRFMFSYNIPELVKSPVELDNSLLVRKAVEGETVKIKGFR